MAYTEYISGALTMKDAGALPAQKIFYTMRMLFTAIHHPLHKILLQQNILLTPTRALAMARQLPSQPDST